MSGRLFLPLTMAQVRAETLNEKETTMRDATMGVLAGVVLMAAALMVFQAVKAVVKDDYPQFAGVVACMVVTILVVAYPVVMGLLLLAALCVGAFLLLVTAGSDAYRSGSFFAGWCCYDMAGELIKLFCLVVVALVQAICDAKS